MRTCTRLASDVWIDVTMASLKVISVLEIRLEIRRIMTRMMVQLALAVISQRVDPRAKEESATTSCREAA